jgi:hypothetical protein
MLKPCCWTLCAFWDIDEFFIYTDSHPGSDEVYLLAVPSYPSGGD